MLHKIRLEPGLDNNPQIQVQNLNGSMQIMPVFVMAFLKK